MHIFSKQVILSLTKYFTNKNYIFSEVFHSEFSYDEVWFTDQRFDFDN